MMGRAKRWLQPSLVRRLVLAQITTAALLWLVLAAYVARDMSMSSAESDLSQMRQGAAMVLPLVQALDKQPELILQTMRHIDEFQRSSVIPTDAQSMLQMPRLYLWRNGQLVYRSVDTSTAPAIQQTKALFEVTVEGLPWRVYAEDSTDGRTRFAVMTPGTPEAAGLSPWSRGWLVLPLLVSLPLLIVPAWLSVRFALRPWARLSSEIATRGADDLSPLAFTPRHRELSPLSHAVDQLLGRLRQSRERERCFVADAAHELRTPIAAIQINAEALQERHLPAEDQELLKGLLRSNARAGRLVAQLLALTRTDASAAKRTSYTLDVEALVQDAMAQWSTVAREQQIELDLESQAGLRVEGDAEALHMLVDNLVGNALKYAPAGSTVRVRAVRNDGQVQLEVLDEGPGIAPELRARVFDRFYRVPGQTQPGSGLGLAIVKSVADQHGASVELTDGPDARGLLVRLRFSA
jgi:signal transduction histidine kinase